MASLLKSLLKTQAPLRTPHKSLPLSPSTFIRTLTSSPQITPKTTQNNNNNKKPLSAFFEEAVELCPRTEDNESESENSELKKRLIELEKEVMKLKKAKPLKGKETLTSEKPKKSVKVEKMEKGTSLYALFTGKEGQNREDMRREDEEENEVFKELSPEMELFVRLLYDQGYFNNVNFLPGNRLEYGCFENSYARDYIKCAADKFGRDHQEIAKWLSGSDLKKVALFGCPSLARKNVFSAKRLRMFFEIQEDTVCSKCMIKESCKFVNQSVWKGDTRALNLADVMRVITLYALESMHRKLIVPDEIKVSVSKLLKEIIKLGQTTA